MLSTSRNNNTTPAIIISESARKENDINYSPDCIRRNKCSLLSTSPASYDESLQFLSQSLEQICRRGSNSSLTNLAMKDGSKSPVVSARPQSFHSNPVKGSLPQFNYIKKEPDGTILLKIRHDETHEKLKQNLSKICSSPGSSSANVRKRISDAQENLKSKFRVKVDINDDTVDLNNLFITIDPQRMLTVSYFVEPVSTSSTKPSVKDLHACKIPECISLEKILCSFQEGPSLYMRPSSSSSVEFNNTNVRHVPIIHSNEDAQAFTVTLKLPTEVSLETIEVKRIDERLIVRALGFRLSDALGRISQVESSLNFQIELPEESDGRKLTAKVFPSRILMFEGKLLPTSRRMTCKF